MTDEKNVNSFISDSNIPLIQQNVSETPKKINENNITISSSDIHKHKKIIETINNEFTAYSYISLIFSIILIILICILINDINCKILNMYYSTQKYNSNVIIKMLIV